MKKITLTLVALMISFVCFAQAPQWKLYDLTEIGVNGGDIICIETDAKGVIWIGTRQGLVKYDNSTFSVFNTDNSDLPGNIIYDIAFDSQGNKWLACKDTINTQTEDDPFYEDINIGLVKFDGIHCTHYHSENSDLPTNNITCIAVDHFDNIWIGLNTPYDLVKFDGNNWTLYDYFTTEVNNYPSNIAIDHEGNICIGSMAGLTKYDDHEFTLYEIPYEGTWQGPTLSLYIDEYQTIWVCSWFGAAGFDGDEWQIFNSDNAPIYSFEGQSMIWDIVNQDGTIWLASMSTPSLMKLDETNEWKVVDFPFHITQMEEDLCGNLWCRTPNGLVVYNETGVIENCDYLLEIDAIASDIFSITPNPAHTQFTIEGKNMQWIEMYNMLGQKVKDIAASSTETALVSTSDLAAGVYMVRIITQSGVQNTQKVIIKH